MTVAKVLERFLSGHGVAYELLNHTPTESLEQAAQLADIPADQFVRAVALRVDTKLWIVVVPLSHVLNFSSLADLLGGEPQPVPADDLADEFSDCEAGCTPALADAYGIATLYDRVVFDAPVVVFEGGSHGSLVRVASRDLRRIVPNTSIGRFSKTIRSLRPPQYVRNRQPIAVADAAASQCAQDLSPADRVRDRIEAIYALPPLPAHAQRILQLSHDANASAAQLARIIDEDPSLTAQVLRYARSPLFSYRGEVDSVQAAISRVLGFDLVMHLALGLAALKSFNNPPDGPLGLQAFWRHASFSALLAPRLAAELAPELRPRPGPLHLAALLHNFGYLAIGHLFAPEFYLLNKIAAANPLVPVTTLERQVLCMGQARDVLCVGHARVGAWLMASWDMPEEVVVAAAEHHNADYQGPSYVYANLMLAVDHLLLQYDIGDADHRDLPDSVCARLGLSAEQAVNIAAELVARGSGMDEMVAQWVA